jgi:rod shape-determining protein MreD
VPGEPSLAARALVAVALPVALFAAVVAQLTIVNRLPLPGGDAPDLVLLLVAAVAVVSTPLIGAVTGFVGGLALDVAPPDTHYAGEYALVFCLTGYATARWRTALYAGSATGDRDPVTTLTIMMIGVAAGEAGKAAVGRLLSDPDVTNAAIRHVLPGAIFYDLLLSPLVLWLVARVAGIAQPHRQDRPARGELIHFGQTATAFRLASAGATSGLRLAGTGRSYLNAAAARIEPRLRFSDGGTVRQAPPPARREVRLRLAGSGALNHGPPPRRERRLRFDGGESASNVRSPARRTPRLRLAGRGAMLTSPSLPRRVPRLRFDGGGELAKSQTAARRVPRLHFDATGDLAKSQSLPRRVPKLRLSDGRAGSLARTNRGSAATAQPLVAGGRAGKLHFAANSPARARPRKVRTPGRDWLRGGSLVRSDGHLRSAATPRFSRRSAPQWAAGNALGVRKAVKRRPGRGWLRPARPKRANWYTGARSTSWLRRSRNPWRRRRERLLRLVGGRR